MPDPRYEVKDDAAQEAMMRLAKLIQGHMAPGWGFNLAIFKMGEPNTGVFFISTADAESTIGVLEGIILRYRAQAAKGPVQ